MKAFKILLTITLIFFIQKSELYSQAPTNGLIAYYPFTGNANDASGNGRNGGIGGGVTLTADRYGNANQAYLFNGVNGAIGASWNQLTGNAARTISVWFKTNSPTIAQYMVSWGLNTSNNSSIVGTHIDSGIPTKYLGFFAYSANTTALNDALQYYDNRWHLMTFTFDGSMSTLYLDGSLQFSKNNVTLNTSSTQLTIGAYTNSPSFFAGSLDEVRIYNRALSQTEVQQMYSAEVAISITTDVLKIGTDRFFHVTGTDNTFLGLRSGAFANSIGSTFVGKNTGQNNTGSYNVFLGLNSGQQNSSGGYNTFIGSFTGQVNTIGKFNTFNGHAAGLKSVTSDNNTFLGYYSGSENTTGQQNTYVGSVAGQYNIQGRDNTYIGFAAGLKNTDSENVFIGRGAGAYTTTGTNNTYIGVFSGLGVETTPNVGSFNTSIGYKTGFKNTTGQNNVLIGWSSGYENTTGSDNTALGTQAGGLTTTGSYNTTFGKLAGYFNVTGSLNTYLGAGADGFGVNKGNLSNATAIGANAKVSISDAIVLGDTANINLKVGIGTKSPSKRLEVRSSNPNESGIRTTNLTASSPTITGNGKVLTVNNLGDFILVPDGGSGTVTNTHSDSVFVRSVTNTNFVGGNLGIGVTLPQYRLDVNGDINLAQGKNIFIENFPLLRGLLRTSGNTALGFDAGRMLSNVAIQNVFLGRFAGEFTTNGSENVFIGWSAGQFNTLGTGNVFVGISSGRNNTNGTRNLFMGSGAGSSNTTGSNNTFIGENAGLGFTSGSYNLFLGSSATTIGTIQRSAAMGYNARVSVNDAIVLGDFESINLKVGIGIHNPQFKLDVNGPINIRGINGNRGELKFSSINFLRGYKNDNSAIGFYAEVDSNYYHSTAIGYKAYASASNVLALGGTKENAVNVGIGNSAPQNRLEITTNIEGESGLTFTNLTKDAVALNSNSKFLSVDVKGKVGLYHLSADQITLKVDNRNKWPDFVFTKGFKLLSLLELERYIKINNHLPNIPSAEEMVEKGIPVEKMISKLLKNQEEMTLHMIEMKKEIEQLKKDNLRLRRKSKFYPPKINFNH